MRANMTNGVPSIFSPANRERDSVTGREQIKSATLWGPRKKRAGVLNNTFSRGRGRRIWEKAVGGCLPTTNSCEWRWQFVLPWEKKGSRGDNYFFLQIRTHTHTASFGLLFGKRGHFRSFTCNESSPFSLKICRKQLISSRFLPFLTT